MIQLRGPFLLVGLLLGLLLAVGVAGCGDGGGEPGGVASLGGASGATSTTTTANAGDDVDPAQAALAYGRCMRQHGIDMPDPQVTGDELDMDLPRGVNRDDPKYQAADQACGRYLPPRDVDPPDLQQRQQALAFARCMRQHGINLPDPQVTAEGITQQNPTGMSRNDPRLQAAERACRQQGGGGGK
jgi:hypothetical protein